MNLDLRLPIGLIFVILGALITGYGLVAEGPRTQVNVNLWWGLVLLAFGILMAYLGGRSKLSKGG